MAWSWCVCSSPQSHLLLACSAGPRLQCGMWELQTHPAHDICSYDPHTRQNLNIQYDTIMLRECLHTQFAPDQTRHEHMICSDCVQIKQYLNTWCVQIVFRSNNIWTHDVFRLSSDQTISEHMVCSDCVQINQHLNTWRVQIMFRSNNIWTRGVFRLCSDQTTSEHMMCSDYIQINQYLNTWCVQIMVRSSNRTHDVFRSCPDPTISEHMVCSDCFQIKQYLNTWCVQIVHKSNNVWTYGMFRSC
jgi:hypothetical protein